MSVLLEPSGRLHRPHFWETVTKLLAAYSAAKEVGLVTTGTSAGMMHYSAQAPYAMTSAEASRRAAAQRQYGLRSPSGHSLALEVAPGQRSMALQNGMYYRPRRHMNVLNPRALRRSIVRVKGFTKFAQRVGSYTMPGRKYRLKGFAKRAKR